MVKLYLGRYICSFCNCCRNLFHTLSRADNTALFLQHIADTVGTGQRLGDGNDQVCHLNQFYQNLGHVVCKRYRFTLGDDACIYLFSGDPHHCNDGKIHHHISQRVHQSGNLADKDLELHKKSIGLIEVLNLIFLAVKGTNYPGAG